MASRSKNLSELLQEAELLSADIGGNDELPRVHRNLHQIAEAGQRLLNKATGDIPKEKEGKASILLSSCGFDVPRTSQRLETLNATKNLEPIDPVWETDIEGFLRNERENTLLSIIEESRNNRFSEADKRLWKHTIDEWDKEKEKILESLLEPSNQEFPELPTQAEALNVDPLSFQGRSALSAVEMAYARELYYANDSELHDVPCALVTKFHEASKSFNDKSIKDSWLLLKMLLDVHTLPPDAHNHRSSSNLLKQFIQKSRTFLEKQYLEYVKDLVYSNLSQSQLGGVPGTAKLIQSYLKLKHASAMPGLEDELVDGQPLWAIVFYCMRCGDLEAARSVLGSHYDVAQYLEEYQNTPDYRLSPTSENTLKQLYNKTVRNSTDPYKKAVFCVLGRCELNNTHYQVLVKTEDYMWLKLCQVNVDGGYSSDQLNFSSLQHLLLKDYGESHFDAQRNPHLYFQVLLLTVQFEAAIEFLSRIDSLRCHAVHFALALHDQNLLHPCESFNSPLLKDEPNGIARLNLGKLVIGYTRKFALTDPREALEYFYRLKDLKDSLDRNLFFSCVSELALESREFEMILGRIEPDGSKRHGCINKFSPKVGEKVEAEITSFIAEEAEGQGRFEDSVRLYDLAQEREKVLELLSHLLSGVVSSPSPPQSDRHRLQQLSVSIAERYRNHGYTTSMQISHTFFLLLDLMQFFDAYHAKRLDQAFDIIKKLHLLPLTPGEKVEQRVQGFRTMSDYVRQCFPDLLLAVMTIICTQYRKASSTPVKGKEQNDGIQMLMSRLRTNAQSLITFAGMIPYQMPGDINARLVQMEVLMN
uniref:Nuclear pore protein n=1 Tax=Amphimedon queenslandica TaxID=400682 RepID=A0A1X7VWE9_AMPQE